VRVLWQAGHGGHLSGVLVGTEQRRPQREGERAGRLLRRLGPGEAPSGPGYVAGQLVPPTNLGQRYWSPAGTRLWLGTGPRAALRQPHRPARKRDTPMSRLASRFFYPSTDINLPKP
jgi:hypothetical protein